LIATLIALLGKFYQSGNFAQVETIARGMLSAIPNDIVALQFLGLALYRLGRVDDARQAFQRIETSSEADLLNHGLTCSEPAAVTSYREATRSGSGLADAWRQISAVLERLGFHQPALRAFRASLKAGIPRSSSPIELRAPLRQLQISKPTLMRKTR
jgi:tetratricopeptide (TPR) repeat protein